MLQSTPVDKLFLSLGFIQFCQEPHVCSFFFFFGGDIEDLNWSSGS